MTAADEARAHLEHVPGPRDGHAAQDAAGDEAQHVRDLIMSACSGVDGLRVTSVMLAEASNRPMAELDGIYYEHLAAVVTDLRDLHRLFDGLNRKLLSTGLDFPDRRST